MIKIYLVSYWWECNLPSGKNVSGDFFKCLEEAKKYFETRNHRTSYSNVPYRMVELICDKEGILRDFKVLREAENLTPISKEEGFFLCCDGSGSFGSYAEIGKPLNCCERPDCLYPDAVEEEEDLLLEGRYYTHPKYVR